ncbi:MAG TPA: STAS domain-containing protein [Nocardioides sp.]|nr:STAS domain-containing protein [Nocardioides sp.]
MQIDRSEVGGATVLAANGRLNMVSAPALKARVDDEVGAGNARLVVDLAGVDFIDSSGLGAIIGGLKAARQAGGDLRIAAAGEQVRAVLGLTNLDRILRPYDSVEEATATW